MTTRRRWRAVRKLPRCLRKKRAHLALTCRAAVLMHDNCAGIVRPRSGIVRS